MKGDQLYLKHILDANVLIHDYMGVDINAVWEITQKNLPPLPLRVESILRELESK